MILVDSVSIFYQALAFHSALNQCDLKVLLLDIVQTLAQYSFNHSQVLSRLYVRSQIFTYQSVAIGTKSLSFALFLVFLIRLIKGFPHC